MTTPIKVEQVTVTLVDRAASWSTYRWIYHDDPAVWEVAEAGHLEGDNDEHFIVQDFARHRIAAEAKTREEDAQIVEQRRTDERAKGNFAQAHVCDDIATAIRSRIPEIKA